MSNRSLSPDTAADLRVRAILRDPKISGFTMIAGAGSGKTTSLIKALQHVIESRGAEFLANRQQVACITYTEIARQEIEDDLFGSPVAHVSTIHSFLWTLIEPFQQDIRHWLARNGQADLERDQFKYDNPRTQAKTRLDLERKIARRRDGLARLGDVTRFQFGVATRYAEGIVGYSDVLKMVPELIKERPLFAKLLSRRYPLVFVDESQDTFGDVVSFLRQVAIAAKGHFCLGFFGDPMQKIYGTGVGEIIREPDWPDVKKPENFRSPRRILDVINAIRADGDRLQQVSGLRPEAQRDGEVTYFVFPTDADRNELLRQAQTWLRNHSAIGAWQPENGVDPRKVLVITHRMAASRLGFEALYDVFHGTRLQESFNEGKAWPLTPFLGTLLPLVAAAQGNRAELLPRLRTSSPLLRPEMVDGTNVRSTLATLSAGIDTLVRVMVSGGPRSVRHALSTAHEHGLIELDERLVRFLPEESPAQDDEADEQEVMLAALMTCDVAELDGYADYIGNESPYSTQQGVKGAEYPDVIVVLDDDEGRHFQFSYDKFLGLKDLSKAEAGRGADEETSIDRTRRLLYVCTSRATRALAIVVYSADVPAAVRALTKFPISATDRVVTAEML